MADNNLTNRRGKNHQGLVILDDGEMPKPQRLNTIGRTVLERHRELMRVDDVTRKIKRKDPRTIESYRKTLAVLQLAQFQLDEIITCLHNALHGD